MEWLLGGKVINRTETNQVVVIDNSGTHQNQRPNHQLKETGQTNGKGGEGEGGDTVNKRKREKPLPKPPMCST